MGAYCEAVQPNTYPTASATCVPTPLASTSQRVGTKPTGDVFKATLTTTTVLSQNEQCAIARTLAGDLNAFNEIVVLYQNLAYSVAYRMLHSRESASDAVQESFFKAYRALSSFRNGGGSFKSWLMRIVVNTCYDMIRIDRRMVLEEIGDDASYEVYGEGDTGQPHQIVDTHESPQAYVERMELSSQIELGLRALPTAQRLVLLLYDVHGYSYEEICNITQLPMGTLKSRISRGRLQMRNFLLQQSARRA